MLVCTLKDKLRCCDFGHDHNNSISVIHDCYCSHEQLQLCGYPSEVNQGPK